MKWLTDQNIFGILDFFLFCHILETDWLMKWFGWSKHFWNPRFFSVLSHFGDRLTDEMVGWSKGFKVGAGFAEGSRRSSRSSGTLKLRANKYCSFEPQSKTQTQICKGNNSPRKIEEFRYKYTYKYRFKYSYKYCSFEPQIQIQIQIQIIIQIQIQIQMRS